MGRRQDGPVRSPLSSPHTPSGFNECPGSPFSLSARRERCLVLTHPPRRLHVGKAKPDLMSEAGDGLTPPGGRKVREKKQKSDEAKPPPLDEGVHPAPPLDESKLRFKAGDRVRCVCKRW